MDADNDSYEESESDEDEDDQETPAKKVTLFRLYHMFFCFVI